MHKLLLVHGRHKRNNMKIRMWNVLLTTIRKARNHCQDDHCEYHLGIDHCQTGNYCQERESNVRMEMSTQIFKTSGLL